MCLAVGICPNLLKKKIALADQLIKNEDKSKQKERDEDKKICKY